MGDHDEPPDVHIQHDQPPIFYCWKYWLTTGEIHEGCTPIEPSDSLQLDLNDYGWVYITVPVVGLFLATFLLYCCCRAGKSKPVKSAPLVNESDDSDVEDFRSAHTQFRAVPVRSNAPSRYYTEMRIEGENKVPLHGGAEPMLAPNQRLYPRLSTMRGNGKPKSETGKSKSAEANAYQPDPTSAKKTGGSPPEKGGKDDTSSAESSDEN